MQPSIFFIQGIMGSSTNEVTKDLIDGGIHSQESVLLCRSSINTEETEPNNNKSITDTTWQIEDQKIEIQADHKDFQNIFIVSDPLINCLDQLEGLRNWLTEENYEIAKIVTVIHTHNLFENQKLNPWYDACIFFSDSVLLNYRQNVPDKWIKEYINKFRLECYPCLFEFVKKNKVKNPSMILDGPPRRLSLTFDPIEEEFELESEEYDDDGELSPEVKFDPMEKLANGAWKTKIPEIASLI